eukprot:jgi/Chrpa1/26412/Chrysochromulina_OHIO_Genome00008670-RA
MTVLHMLGGDVQLAPAHWMALHGLVPEAAVAAKGHPCSWRCRSLRRLELARAVHESIPHELDEMWFRPMLPMNLFVTVSCISHLDSVAPYATPREHWSLPAASAIAAVVVP